MVEKTTQLNASPICVQAATVAYAMHEINNPVHVMASYLEGKFVCHSVPTRTLHWMAMQVCAETRTCHPLSATTSSSYMYAHLKHNLSCNDLSPMPFKCS
jgi:hypothetical protein